MMFTRGQRIAVAKYHGHAYGTVRSVLAGFVTVDMDDDNYMPGGSREIFDLSRRTVRSI